MPLNNKFHMGWRANRHARMVEIKKQANRVCEMIGAEIKLEENKSPRQREVDREIGYAVEQGDIDLAVAEGMSFAEREAWLSKYRRD